jgi:hypothetical protein
VCGIGSIPSDSLGGSNLIPPLKGSPCEGRDSRLHADFDCFPGTEEDIGDELCGGGGREVECRSIFMGGFLADEVAVFFLEEFVETVFTGTWGLVPVHGSEKNRGGGGRGEGGECQTHAAE